MTSITSLVGDHKNARRRTDRSTELIKESLKRYGAARSIVIDEENRILAGNGTIDGAKAAGIKNVRIIETDGDEIIAVKRTGLTEGEKVGLALADNRTADLAEWDQEMLHQLSEQHDLSPWFEQDDLDELLNITSEDPVEGHTDPDDVPEVPEDPTTKPGDLWILGNHRLLCGDSTNPQHVERLMDGKKAELTFTSPPYNLGDSVGLRNGARKNSKSAYNNYSDNSEKDWADLMCSVINNSLLVSAKTVVNVQMLAGNKTEFLKLLGKYADHTADVAIWQKTNPQPAMAEKVMNSAFEFMWFLSPKKYPTRSIDGATFSRGTFSNVFSHATASGHDASVHGAVFPVQVANHYLTNLTAKNELIFEPFAGSGTTLISAHQHSRQCYGMELDPAYCDVIRQRWEDFTGNTAVCEPSLTHFDEEEVA